MLGILRVFAAARRKLRPRSTSLAPSLTLVLAATVVAHIVRLAASREDSPFAFSCVSNAAYLAAGLLCPSDDGALAVMLTGAASLAYHSEHHPSSHESHVLDIALGWVLIVHLAFAPLLAGARLLAAHWKITDDSDLWWLRTLGRVAAYAVLATALVLMFSLYDTIKNSGAVGGNGQLILYFIAAPIAALAIAIERIFVLTVPATPSAATTALARDKGPLTPYAEALVETHAMLWLVAGAVVTQGDLLGRKLQRQISVEEYDLFHGTWHVQVALVAAVVYERVDDVNRRARGEQNECVCYSRWPEIALLVGLTLYGILAVILKEASAGVVASEVVLGVTTLLLFALGAYAWFDEVRARRANRYSLVENSQTGSRSSLAASSAYADFFQPTPLVRVHLGGR